MKLSKTVSFLSPTKPHISNIAYQSGAARLSTAVSWKTLFEKDGRSTQDSVAKQNFLYILALAVVSVTTFALE